MIDLGETRDGMLARIGAGPVETTISVALHGTRPKELVPPLCELLEERYANIPLPRLTEDLLSPVKKGIGNAWKRGNLLDASKRITVDAVMTDLGAVVRISDEGPGFDVAGLVGQCRRGERWFQHGGNGFTRFRKTQSVISYADGGSTLLICFQCDPGAGRAPSADDGEKDAAYLDVELIRDTLVRTLPCFVRERRTLDDLEVQVPEDEKEGQHEVGYVLHLGPRNGHGRIATLRGRSLPSDLAARDYATISDLFATRRFSLGEVRVPKPVALVDDPLSLALYRFRASRDLRRYLKRLDSFDDIRTALRSIAGGVRGIHRSGIEIGTTASLADMLGRQEAAAARITEALAPVDAELTIATQQVMAGLRDRAAEIDDETCPIHGDFGWDRVLHGGGGFVIHRFEHSLNAHPGFDVGAFIADAYRHFVISDKGSELIDDAREAFLGSYADGETPAWFDHLGFFTAASLLLRLDRLVQRLDAKSTRKAAALLEHAAAQVEA